ncbi:efflux transporter periplasmic adaptor subunit [Pseudomonas sp. MYb187]|uniref:efflux RND transporter periplasmic adaptor subunit n=1 Tax=Pseudomonas TaxID=286 RepID=UPI000CFCE3C4|nr:efflux transporter periplasmic adaptor subunit [Pseudomonas sp. MYb187]
MGKRMLWGVGVGVAVLGAMAIVIAQPAKDASTQATAWPLTKVALATVMHTEAPREAFAAGELEAAHQVQIAAETPGRITQIAFKSGQVVKAGQLLVQLNDAPEQAERLRLQAALVNARTLFQRSHKLRAKNAVSQEVLDNATAALGMARGELQKIDALIAQKAIRAPFAGKVGIRRVHQGQYVQAGEAVVSLVDARHLHVNFTLHEKAAADLRVGQAVALSVDALPQRALSAQVNAIDPMIGKSRSVEVQASLANPDGQLQAGMYTSVRLAAAVPTRVMAVPEAAVTYTAYGQTVFLATQGNNHSLTVSRIQVTTGERWKGQVEITSGLKAGDQVVVSGQLKLSDGMPVEAVDKDSLQAVAGGRAS